MSRWRVNPIGKNRAEVLGPRVRYFVEANSTSLTLRVFASEKRPIETASIRHVGRNYSLQGANSAGRSERRTMRFAGKRVISKGVVDGKPFALASSVCTHAGLLIEKLKGRKPLRLPHITALMEQLKTDGRLRGQLQSQVNMTMMMAVPDSVVFACIIICAECVLTGGELACTLCSLCLKPDPGTG
jgi:hypothetical protein